jgi:hypothetical protein
LGSLFRLGAVLAQKVLQRWKMSRIPLFRPKSGKIAFLRFWSKKGAQNVTFIKGFALLAERVEFGFLHFSVIFSILCRAKKNLHVAFILTEIQLFDEKHSSPKGLFSLGKSMILGPKIAQDRFFAIFAVKTAKNAQNAFWAPKCDFYRK